MFQESERIHFVRAELTTEQKAAERPSVFRALADYIRNRRKFVH